MALPPVATLIERGQHAFRYWHNYSAENFPQNYKIPESGAQAYINANAPRLFEFMGKWAIQANLSETEIRDRMQAFSKATKGLLPKKLNLFLDALDPVKDPNITTFDTIRLYTGAVVGGVADTAADLAKSSGEALKSSLSMLPVALVAGILLFAFVKAKA
jgi:hypothetical protein